MKIDVFISYSSVNKPIADAICHNLESKSIKCWYAPRDILPGMDWTESIIEAIEHSAIMVLVFSRDSNQSVQVKREVERAVHHNKMIIPFRIEDVTPTKSMEYLIGMHHWLDAFSLKEENAAIKRLTEAIQQNLVDKVEATASDPESSGGPPGQTEQVSDGSLRGISNEAESIYVNMLEVTLADGAITPFKREKLTDLARQLGIRTERAMELEKATSLGSGTDSSVTDTGTAAMEMETNLTRKSDEGREPEISRPSSRSKQEPTVRDKTKYIFQGRRFGKGRLVHALIACYLKSNPDTTFAQLKIVFPDVLHSTKYGVFTSLEDAENIKTTTGHERFFLDAKDVLQTKEGKRIAVCSQWGIGNIQPILKKAEDLKYEIIVTES